jgi:hypothetical protein
VPPSGSRNDSHPKKYCAAIVSVSVTDAWAEIWFKGRNSSLASTPGVAKPFCRSSGFCA